MILAPALAGVVALALLTSPWLALLCAVAASASAILGWRVSWWPGTSVMWLVAALVLLHAAAAMTQRLS
ncbi:MAG: hypothetical protein ABF296_07160, partial [Oceanococcaceae bacterium]